MESLKVSPSQKISGMLQTIKTGCSSGRSIFLLMNGVNLSAFKIVSDQYKERRCKKIPHTCSRKGMVRLTEEMKDSPDPSKVTRLNVWVKSHTKKDGTPVNTNAAEKIKKASEIDSDAPSSSTNPKEDLLSQIVGQDKPGQRDDYEQICLLPSQEQYNCKLATKSS